jgi:multidrug transporter EmrE-like cation transporter
MSKCSGRLGAPRRDSSARPLGASCACPGDNISAKPHGLAWAGLFTCGLALGAINVFLFTTALRELKLAIAYPVFAGASITLIVLLSAWFFDENVTSTNFAGAALVALGIALLSL